MTGYQSKKAAALDEEGFYTIHPKDEDDDIQVYQRPWVGLTDREKSNLWLESRAAIPRFHTYASLVEAKLREKNQFKELNA